MVYLVDIAICSLNQWALDFIGNKKRIIQSIREAAEKGCKYRSGPELEICGYSCQDHFLEPDTELHCWEMLVDIIEATPDDIIVDVGMPVCLRGVRYNCRVIFLNRTIHLIRPKAVLANERNYREERWFTAWTGGYDMDRYELPQCIHKVLSHNQTEVPFGTAMLKLKDNVVIGFEICEELWAPKSISVDQALCGADIIFNSSGSHHQLYKFKRRVDLITSASNRAHCFYFFSNLHGGDGDRLLFDGGSMIARDGDLLVVGPLFSFKEVELLTARIDLDEIRASRSGIGSRQVTAASQKPRFEQISITSYNITTGSDDLFSIEAAKAGAFYSRDGPKLYDTPTEYVSMQPEAEIACGGPCLWMFDYLRRSKMSGFMLPLSGGIDSAATACIAYSVAKRMFENRELKEVADLLAYLNTKNKPINSAQDITALILTTVYLPRTGSSSSSTEQAAAALAADIGSNHHKIPIDGMVAAALASLPKAADFISPGFSDDSDWRASLAMQNIQARTRMVLTYLAAACCDSGRGKLVLASSNADECLTGYLTKYDCSAGDLNPIGAIAKEDLKKVVLYMAKEFNLKSLETIYKAPPTAELKPLADGEIEQTDEDDMGMTYKELNLFGKLRSQNRCGPLSMYRKLMTMSDWAEKPEEAAVKTKRFFTRYAKNRHKMTVTTPSVHADNYSPDDNRHDLRPFLIDAGWQWQFQKIDELAGVK